jgi:Lipocalin-like domain
MDDIMKDVSNRRELSKRRNTMKWSMKEVARVLLVVAVLVVGSWSGTSKVYAQEKGAGLAQQVQGSWVLVSIYSEQDGKKTDVYGPNPRGSLILSPDGRFSIILMRASLPKFASNSRVKGTAEENQAVVQGSAALLGTYTVASDEKQMVNLHIEGCTFPNWDGQDQMRIMTVNGDELKVTTPAAMILGETHYITWKRAK